jgi:hypothetical protein
MLRACRLIATAAILSALAGCAPSSVKPMQTYQGAALPRPEIVIVTDFTAAPDAVKLDRGIGARLRTIVSGTSAAAQQSADDRKVAAAIATTLVAEIEKLGLPALYSNDIIAETGHNKLVLGGEILSIDEGNRTRRNIIGLGAGSSEVAARADVYYDRGGTGERLIESFTANAESSRKPGAAETMGVGAATGRVAESAAANVGTGLAPSLSGDVAGDGTRMAKAIAQQLGPFFVSQGWVPAAAAR